MTQKTDENWRLWNHHSAYGELLFKRATGELPEMESSKALCKILKPLYKQKMQLADIGCGAGHYLRSLKNHLDNDIHYTGVDATKYYVELARQAFPETACFLQGDIFNLPLPDQSQDIVTCNNLLLHLPPFPSKAIEELIRISKHYTIIRTVFAERDYIIKEMRYEDELDSSVISTGEKYKKLLNNIDQNRFNYFNMYTKDYFQYCIKSIAPKATLEFINDTMWDEYDNTELTTSTGTRTQDKMQISGNLVLDWKFILIRR